MNDEQQEQAQESELHILDNSSLNLFMLCARKFYYMNTLKLQLTKESEALTVGSAIHEFLCKMWAGSPKNECITAFLDYIRKPTSADIDIELNEETSEKRGGQQYSIEWLLFVLGLYYKRFPIGSEKFEVVKGPDNKPYLEVGFALDLGKNKIHSGKIDAIVRMKDTGDLWIVDHKTTRGVLNDTFFKKFMLNGQLTGYLLAATEMLGETPKGCIINALRVTQLKHGTVDAVTEKIFSRSWTFRTTEQLQEREFEVSALMDIIIALNKLNNKYAFYKNAPNACSAFYRTCEFLPLCVAKDDGVRDTIKESNYMKRAWEPHKG